MYFIVDFQLKHWNHQLFYNFRSMWTKLWTHPFPKSFSQGKTGMLQIDTHAVCFGLNPFYLLMFSKL